MYTLDPARKRKNVKKLPTGPQGFSVVESNGQGVLIVEDKEGFWMSVPQRKQGNVALYPMVSIVA